MWRDTIRRPIVWKDRRPFDLPQDISICITALRKLPLHKVKLHRMHDPKTTWPLLRSIPHLHWIIVRDLTKSMRYNMGRFSLFMRNFNVISEMPISLELAKWFVKKRLRRHVRSLGVNRDSVFSFTHSSVADVMDQCPVENVRFSGNTFNADDRLLFQDRSIQTLSLDCVDSGEIASTLNQLPELRKLSLMMFGMTWKPLPAMQKLEVLVVGRFERQLPVDLMKSILKLPRLRCLHLDTSSPTILQHRLKTAAAQRLTTVQLKWIREWDWEKVTVIYPTVIRLGIDHFAGLHLLNEISFEHVSRVFPSVQYLHYFAHVHMQDIGICNLAGFKHLVKVTSNLKIGTSSVLPNCSFQHFTLMGLHRPDPFSRELEI